jgi:phosphopantetheine adenylyltransferase
MSSLFSGCLNVPVKLLPAGSREGDIVTIGIERDEFMTRATKERVRDLITKLKNKE